MKIIRGIFYFFDKLEDVIRGGLSKHPFIYTFIGGVGVVLFWRGVWQIADHLESYGGLYSSVFSSTGSVILGTFILLSTGLFVSVFIGGSIIMSGVKRENKMINKTEDEIEEMKTAEDVEKTDAIKTLDMMAEIKEELEMIEKRLPENPENSTI